jgi:hypothetical protein
MLVASRDAISALFTRRVWVHLWRRRIAEDIGKPLSPIQTKYVNELYATILVRPMVWKQLGWVLFQRFGRKQILMALMWLLSLNL